MNNYIAIINEVTSPIGLNFVSLEEAKKIANDRSWNTCNLADASLITTSVCKVENGKVINIDTGKEVFLKRFGRTEDIWKEFENKVKNS